MSRGRLPVRSDHSFSRCTRGFYGLPKIYADLLIEPDLTIENFATPRTRVVHLWNEHSKRLIDRAPPGSPIARLIEEGRSVPLA